MKYLTLLMTALLVFFVSAPLLANKTGVDVIIPETATIGETVTVTIEVEHRGNSRMHYTDWVYVKLDGEEVKRWEFDRSDLPKNENFTVAYAFEFSGETKVEVEGNCNLHGSEGVVVKTIKVAQD